MAEELLLDADSEIITDSEGENLTVYAVSTLEDSLSLNLVRGVTFFSGITYYVDATGGLDTNSGRTTDEAWQTITKVNGETFSPGDRILFKRGETFAGQLTPTNSGVSGNVITFGAYGTGALPIIDGIAARALVVTSTYAFLRFENLHFYRSAGTNECAIPWSHDLYFYNCEVSYSGGLGITSWSADGTDIYNVTYDSCLFHHNFRSGIYVGSTTAPGPHNVLVTYCEAYNNGWGQPPGSGVGNGIYVKYGVTVEYCVTHDNIEEGGIKTSCEAGAGLATIYFPIVRNCTSYGDKDGLYCACNGSIFHNNLVYDSINVSLLFDSYASDCEIYFNTMVNAKTYGAIIVSDPTIQNNNIIKNNIIVQDATVEAHYLNSTSGADSLQMVAEDNTWDYNIYYYNGNTGSHAFYDGATSAGRDWVEWTGYTGTPDVNSVYLSTTPDFVTRYIDLHPADGGDLKGLGLAIVGYETDKEGVTRADPPTPGCFETAGIVLEGSTTWGHITGVTEDNIEPFANNWVGTGARSGTLDTEKVCMDSGEYMISGVVHTGSTVVTLLYDTYGTGTFAGTLIFQYRHGTTEANCRAASWQTYTVPFTSDGYVQVRIEAP